MKRFNTTGVCLSSQHYMVDLTERVKEIKAMIDCGDYFCINRGRQYGKTTTLDALKNALAMEYTVFSISFEGIGNTPFTSEERLCAKFLDLLQRQIKYKAVSQASENLIKLLDTYCANTAAGVSMDLLGERISELCMASTKPVVIMIDEVDQASNYESFIKFLGMLRSKYLARMNAPTFQSVILAGIYNVKNLKAKIRHDKEHQYNSPWNIAVDFDISMELSENGIAGMLSDYEQDHHTGMDIQKMARLLFEYTGGYPFLVSRLCQIIDEKPLGHTIIEPSQRWTKEGLLAAEKLLLSETNTLFDDLSKKVDENPELKSLLYAILFGGEPIRYSPYDKAQSLGLMFNFIKNMDGFLAVSNRIFETLLYNAFTYEEEKKDRTFGAAVGKERELFVQDGHLDMQKVLERFSFHYGDTFEKRRVQRGSRLNEDDARISFLMFLIPIINGTGHYYVETGLVDRNRMDVVVDYNGEQFIVELKIWRGAAYHKRGVDQLCGYLDQMHTDKGYLLTFNFNEKKTTGIQIRQVADKTIVEVMV